MMDGMQQVFGVLFVLGLLGGTLWWLRSKGMAQIALKLPAAARKSRSLKVIECVALTPQHSIFLVSIKGRTLLVATAPGGCSVLEDIATSTSLEQSDR